MEISYEVGKDLAPPRDFKLLDLNGNQFPGESKSILDVSNVVELNNVIR